MQQLRITREARARQYCTALALAATRGQWPTKGSGREACRAVQCWGTATQCQEFMLGNIREKKMLEQELAGWLAGTGAPS